MNYEKVVRIVNYSGYPAIYFKIKYWGQLGRTITYTNVSVEGVLEPGSLAPYELYLTWTMDWVAGDKKETIVDVALRQYVENSANTLFKLSPSNVVEINTKNGKSHASVFAEDSEIYNIHKLDDKVLIVAKGKGPGAVFLINKKGTSINSIKVNGKDVEYYTVMSSDNKNLIRAPVNFDIHSIELKFKYNVRIYDVDRSYSSVIIKTNYGTVKVEPGDIDSIVDTKVNGKTVEIEVASSGGHKTKLTVKSSNTMALPKEVYVDGY